MYFWKDDFAVMIKAASPEEAVGFLGPGLKGEGAYSYVSTPFSLLYPTFGLNPFWYFLVGLILYYLSSVAVFYLAKEIFKDNFKALLVSLIYSAGYIGADTIYGLMNSYQSSWITIFLCISLILFIRSFEKPGILKYILSLALFYLSLETGYIRAHGFFLIVLATAFIVIIRVNINEILWFAIKLLPFFLIFRKFYLSTVTAGVGSSRLTQAISENNYDYFLNPFITFGNLIFPSHIVIAAKSLIYYLNGKNYQESKIYVLLSILFIVFNLSILPLFYFLIKNKKEVKELFLNNLRIMLFGITSAVGSFIGVFYIAAASSSLNSTHRYLTTALIGLAFYWIGLISLFVLIIFHKKKLVAIQSAILLACSFAIILTYMVLANIYTIENIIWRTYPQKKFFTQLKTHIPALTEKSFIYIDYSNKNGSNARIGNIFGTGMVGGSPEIAVHYGVDRYSVVSSIGSFKDFIARYKLEKGNLDNTYAMYFEDNNLIDYTSSFREILKNGKTGQLSISQLGLEGEKEYIHKVWLENNNSTGGLDIKNNLFEIDFPKNTSSLGGGILKFDLKIIPQISTESSQLTGEDEAYLQYLLSKSKIKNNSTAKVLNHFQDQTEDNLFDGKNETNWMADRGDWHNLIHKITSDIQFIEVSLKNPINLGGILFMNGHNLRTPTSYRILIKENGNWKEIKETDLAAPKNSGEVWFDKIEPILTSEVRIEILNSSSGDAPQLAEIELVESQFSDLDFNKALQIETDPSVILRKNPGSPAVKDYFGLNGKLSFSYLSNKDNYYNVPDINFRIKGLDGDFSYEIPIPANGTNLIKGKFFNLNFPGHYIFSNFQYINPPISYYLNQE
jgi:hypothetical protein